MCWNCGKLSSMESAKSSSDDANELIKSIQEKEISVQTLRARLDETVADLSESNQQEAEHLKNQKHFVHFLYQLSLAQSLEELFLIASEQFEMNSMVKPQIFMLQYQTVKARYYEVHGHSVRMKFADGIALTGHYGMVSEQSTQWLANFFGRPMGSVFFFKAYLPNMIKFVPELECFIIFESFQSEKPRDFLDQLKSHVDLMSLVLDRQMLRFHSFAYVEAWEKTFDHFKDPICIKDLNGVVIRSNAAFQGSLKWAEDYEIQQHQLINPQTKEPRATIELYINKTEFEELRRQQVLNEKMTALGRMAGNIAHELNNPLTGILSMAQVLKDELKGEQHTKLREDIDEVQKATIRCQKIIADLTQFSTNGAETGAELRTSMDEAVEVVLSLLKTALRRHHTKIELNTNSYWIAIPMQLLQQVLFNLINNACQAMEDGGNLEIRTNVTEIFGHEVCQILIVDSGPGIAEEVRKKLFDPFVTTKAKGQGTGLGLHLSKLIIEKYKGRIYFESKTSQNSKTTFVVQLPVSGSIV